MILNKNKIGLAFGGFLAVLHLVWALTVAVMPNALQSFLDWIYKVHFLNPVFVLTKFNPLHALYLVLMTSVFGFVFGWTYALIHNWIDHGKK